MRNDLAYPAMLSFLPAGWLGLVVASLAAAYMSTISTHLNWGASYMVEDLYRRFVADDRDEGHYVMIARLSTVLLTVLMGALALVLENALQAFQILLQIGAGTGLVFLLRWFWWRINAWSEISAMVISFAVAVWFQFAHAASGLPELSASSQLVVGVAITTLGWLAVTFVTPPTDGARLRDFHTRIRPMGRGWQSVATNGEGAAPSADESWTAGLLAWFLSCVAVYATLFATGSWLYGHSLQAGGLAVIAIASSAGVLRLMTRLRLR